MHAKWKRFVLDGAVTSASQVALMAAVLENAIRWQQAKRSVLGFLLLLAQCAEIMICRSDAAYVGAIRIQNACSCAMDVIEDTTPFASTRPSRVFLLVNGIPPSVLPYSVVRLTEVSRCAGTARVVSRTTSRRARCAMAVANCFAASCARGSTTSSVSIHH